MSLRKRETVVESPPSWLWQDVWLAVIGAYTELRGHQEPELLRSIRVCENAIQEVANAETVEDAEAASVATLGTRSGPLLVRAIRAGHPGIVRAKLLEDFHLTLWPDAVKQGGRALPGERRIDDVLDDGGWAELEALCFSSLRRYASDATWGVMVESAEYDTDRHPNPRFAEALRLRL